MHRHACHPQKKHEKTSFAQYRMLQQPTEFTRPRQQHPHHRQAQQSISCIRHTNPPRVVIDRQPASLLVRIVRRLIKAVAVTHKDAVHRNGSRLFCNSTVRHTDITDVVCRCLRTWVIRDAETVQMQRKRQWNHPAAVMLYKMRGFLPFRQMHISLPPPYERNQSSYQND